MIGSHMQNKLHRIPLLLALVSAMVATRLAGAQESEINVQTTTRVTRGKSAAHPSETALVPIYSTPAKSIPVGQLRFDVTFVSANAKFDKVEPGPVADGGRVQLNTQLKTGKN